MLAHRGAQKTKEGEREREREIEHGMGMMESWFGGGKNECQVWDVVPMFVLLGTLLLGYKALAPA